MDVKELSQLSAPPEKHWYYSAKFALLADAVAGMRARTITDIGAGSGVFARLLLERTDCREATCVDPAYEMDQDEDVHGKLLKFRRSPAGDKCDLALLMDVLEHVDDDVALLSDVSSNLASGTPFFVTVPAFQFLWSAHDEFLEHRRRYTAQSLRRTLEGANLKIESIRYYYAAILPAVALVRLVSRARPPKEGSDLRDTPAPVAWLLAKTLQAERRFLYPWNRFGGLSVVAIARKK